MRILLAEDEKSLARAVSTILGRNGWDVDVAEDGTEALQQIRAKNYDAVVLDIMMPKMDGITVLQTVRADGNLTPVIMLTAKSEVADKVAGLDAGANDYLAKPFEPAELIARIKSITRAQEFQNHPVLSMGNVTLDRQGMEVSTPSGSLRLAYKECQMLEMLMDNSQGSITQERLLEKIWKNDGNNGESVKLYAAYLKRKLDAIHADIFLIEQDGTYRIQEAAAT